MTPWERLLWNVVRNKQIKGVKFRRQFSIPPYVVDFISLENKLILEIDGGQHNQEEEIKKDANRQKYLEEKGYKVLRFWNNDIQDNLSGVVQVILQNL